MLCRKGREVEKNVSSSSNDSHGVSQPSSILINITIEVMDEDEMKSTSVEIVTERVSQPSPILIRITIEVI